MIVRLATFASPTPDVRAEALRNLLERFKPALVAQPGFVAGYWAEAADGRLFSITVWESEAAVERAGAAANATPLLPGQDPAKIPSPERVETLAVVTAA
jgi:Antibiotic biosynthesis monooxygenase